MAANNDVLLLEDRASFFPKAGEEGIVCRAVLLRDGGCGALKPLLRGSTRHDFLVDLGALGLLVEHSPDERFSFVLIRLVVLRLEFERDGVIIFAKADCHREGLVVAVLLPGRGDSWGPDEPLVSPAVCRNVHPLIDVILPYHRVLKDVVHNATRSESGKLLRGMLFNEGPDQTNLLLGDGDGRVGLLGLGGGEVLQVLHHYAPPRMVGTASPLGPLGGRVGAARPGASSLDHGRPVCRPGRGLGRGVVRGLNRGGVCVDLAQGHALARGHALGVAGSWALRRSLLDVSARLL